MNEEIFLKFKKLLEFAYNNEYSDFYRTKYEKAGFNPLVDFNSMDDVKKIPFLTKKELSEADPLKLLFVDEKEVFFIRATSGTTGKPIIFFNPPRFNLKTELEQYGSKRCLILRRYVDLGSAALQLQNRGIWMIPGDINNIPSSIQIASQLKIDTIQTSPTLAVMIGDRLYNYPEIKESLKIISLSGELVTPSRKTLLAKLFPNVKIFLNYGLAEGGRVGFQCEHLAKKEDEIYYHIYSKNIDFEIIDPDSEKETKTGEKGELVLTNLSSSTTPIIRYKTGDLVSLAEIDCQCGLPAPLLQVWGRINRDMIRVAGFEFRTYMLDKSMINLRNFIKDSFEIHIYKNLKESRQKINLSINLSLKENIKESEEIKQMIKGELLENWWLSQKLNLKTAINLGIVGSLQIDFVYFQESQKSKRLLILHES